MSEGLEYLARGADAELVVARAALARRQAALLAALVAGGPPPPGFDPEQIRAQALGLAAKRRDTVAKVVPELPQLLGPAFGPLFLRYARQRPQDGGYRADGRAFAEWLLADGHRAGEPAGAGPPGPTEEPAPDRRRALESWLAPAGTRVPPQRSGPLDRLRRALRPQQD
ncbi:hypothetical protein [Kitasatospora sp. NBC_00240]|jgi:hypothetical protein|uniref:hypothetical protein n=1 Tax=Kitasatospora sp. NBC_00240 TaxID=2903567 RepID=UPI002B1CEA9E|nr:hypothetical protein [Kitasatospora sp. NBC_00240]